MSIKSKLFLAGTLILLVFAYFLSLNISHLNKSKVSIEVIPADAKIMIDGKQSKAGSIYMTPGKYKFTAHKDGYKDDSLSISVADKPVYVGLVPEPVSEAAKQLLKDNPEIQQQRERIGGQRTNARGLMLEANNPIIKLLPYTDINGPFVINYGPSDERENGVIITVNDSSPQGRSKAIKWIKKKGFDPSSLDIRFDDFVNPLTTTVEP